MTGRACVRGQALHFLDGVSPAELRTYEQAAADKRVAELFGISRAHAVLLRIINDSRPGAPSVVIRDPAQVLGDQAETVLAFWRHLDRMTPQQWAAVRAGGGGCGRDDGRRCGEGGGGGGVGWAVTAAEARAARAAARAAAAAARAVEWDMATARRALRRATNEIQGAAVLRALGRPFFFLPMFGIAQPEDLIVSSEVKP
jgi:hypothetical protein